MSYASLVEHHRRAYHLRHVEAILAWDEATMMSSGGGEARTEALTTLRGILHAHKTDPRLGDWLAAAEEERACLGPWERANLREMRREWVQSTALPRSLVEAMSRAESRSEQAWRSLRPANDFKGLQPLLAEVIKNKREAGQALGARLGLSAYDALLDSYEPGATSAQIQPLFARLREFLPTFIERVLGRQRSQLREPLRLRVPESAQRELGQRLMERVGFDSSRGRLDTSHHPFCGGVPDDVRITTRYDENDFIKSLMSVLHETGHAKYEQNLPPHWLLQPVGQARGMGIHESQSLLLEMQIGRSREFLEFLTPLIWEVLGQSGIEARDTLHRERLHRDIGWVEKSLIRVDADEVTYPCHIILRTKLERELINSSLAIEELPEAWNHEMQELLGLSTLGNDRDGCMQDVHWPVGLIGYFPTYTLGALTAAQLFRAARSALPGLMGSILEGDLTPLDTWLRERVWTRGSLDTTGELIERATGSPLSTLAFEQHLTERYLEGE